MNVLVLGGSGLLGSALVYVLEQRCHRVLAPTRSEYDVLAGPLPASLLSGSHVVVNAAFAKPPVERELDRKLNAEFPQGLARLCAAANVPLIHFSTDGVFSARTGPCDESVPPVPDEENGLHKLMGEPRSCLVIRTSALVGPENRGFHSILCWFLSQEREAPGFTNQWWNGVTSPTLALAVARLIETGTIPTGIRHMCAEDVTKFELLVRLAKVFKRKIEIKPTLAPIARDRRLRTRFPEFLATCDVPSLDAQLAELPALADERGRWRT